MYFSFQLQLASHFSVGIMSDIHKKYTDLRLAGSYNALSGFLRNHKEFHDPKAVHKELMKLQSYSLHLPVRKKFKSQNHRQFSTRNFLGGLERVGKASDS